MRGRKGGPRTPTGKEPRETRVYVAVFKGPFEGTDLDDAQKVLAEMRRVWRYDAGWFFWSLMTPPAGANPDQIISATRATFYAGPKKSNAYVSMGSKRVSAAKAVWLWHKGQWPKSPLKYLDGDPKNNRIENLTDDAVFKQERIRKHPIGVCPMGPDHWQAYARINGRPKCLGRFKTRDAAISARQAFDSGLDLF